MIGNSNLALDGTKNDLTANSVKKTSLAALMCRERPDYQKSRATKVMRGDE